jgi:hypothetical protein
VHCRQGKYQAIVGATDVQLVLLAISDFFS